MVAAETPEHYPARWETDVVLSDGGTVHVRPIRPDDAPRLVEFHGRQSAESIYYRYFSPRPHLPEREVARLTNLDYVERMAFVVLLGDAMIGVARYDRADPAPDGSPRAEVAFFIDDRHHGRGLATLLLEFLAVAAEEAGIKGFVATVLPDNRGMINVFRRAGFEVSTAFSDGVVEVNLGIHPTAEGQLRIEERQRRAEVASVARLLTPATVAVVGAGRSRSSLGHALLRQLLEGGFNGVVYPVNPNTTHVGGVKAYPTVSAIPDEVDLVVVAVPLPAVDAIVADCAQKRVDALLVVTDGFSGMDAEAVARQRALVSAVRRGGMRLIGPASAGVVNHAPEVRLRASFALDVPPPGRVALSTQSGSMGAAILAYATETGLGVSTFVNLGDKTDLSTNDLLQYWEEDPAAAVVCLYVESFGNARKFFRVARRVSRRKPLVVMRTAGLDFGGLTWPSPDTFSALMTQAGILEVESLAEMFDLARLLAAQPLPAGRRVAVLANSPGTAVLGVETMRRGGLDARPYVLDGDPQRFAATVESAVFDPVVDLPPPLAPPPDGTEDGPPDAVVVVFAQTVEGRTGAVHAAVDRAIELRRAKASLDPGGVASTRPVLACYLGEQLETQVCAEGDVPRFRFPEDAARALAHAVRYAEWCRSPEGEPHTFEEFDAAAVAAVVDRGLDGVEDPAPRTLPLDDALALLRAVGLHPLAQQEAHSLDAALAAAERIGYPVALKAGRRGRLARSVATGLALAIGDAESLRRTYQAMSGQLGDATGTVLVQAMAEPGIEALIIGHQDSRLGPLVALGRGGALGSAAHELAVRSVPLTDIDTARLLAASPLQPLLERLDSVAPLAAFEAVLGRLSLLMERVPEVVEVRLDPVLLSSAGVAITDVQVQLAPVVVPLEPAVRRIS